MNKIKQLRDTVLLIALIWCALPQIATAQAGGISADGKLQDCPRSPNCVSTQAAPTDKRHYFPPIPYTSSREIAQNRFSKLLAGRKRTYIVEEKPGYIHSEYRVSFFGFVDDIEVYFPEDEAVIHLRSASRKGYGDMGANRTRARALRQQFQESKAD